jgi:hypothetical protein
MLDICSFEVPGRGLEPLRISPPDPKSGASANFATLAHQFYEGSQKKEIAIEKYSPPRGFPRNGKLKPHRDKSGLRLLQGDDPLSAADQGEFPGQ